MYSVISKILNFILVKMSKSLYVIGKDNIPKDSKYVGKFLTSLNAFPVDRENPGPSTLKRPINLLKDNKTVGIFPTGSRTSQEGAPLKRGASTIAMLSKSPILPVAYVGPTKIHGLLTGQAYINIGELIDINELPKDLKRNERIDYITKEIETRTAKLQQELHEIVKSL
ncbi:1-acyl-sn-glycerol-3-phosphate acyltransferase [Staphylococcus aureus]